MANYSVPQKVHLWEGKDRFLWPGWPPDHSLLLFVWAWPRTANAGLISWSTMSHRIKDSQNKNKREGQLFIRALSYSPNNLRWLSYHSRPVWYSIICLPSPSPNLSLLPPSPRNLFALSLLPDLLLRVQIEHYLPHIPFVKNPTFFLLSVRLP